MWCLALLVLADSLTATYAVPVAAAETLALTVLATWARPCTRSRPFLLGTAPHKGSVPADQIDF